MLELQHISFSVASPEGTTDIIRDISLTVPDGELLVLTGPNGGGKTTLARIIMGLVRPTDGRVLWNGEDITELDITERARRGIAYGFQQPPRFKGIKVGDLLSIASGKKLMKRAEACSYLTQVGLCAADYIDREVDTSLSGGEVKRIEIATILARRCGMMILDEPEAGIDLWSFSRLTETFRDLHAKREATMIIISHQERILVLADRIAVISDGQLSRQGPVEEIFPAIIAVAEACPAMERKESCLK
jgi:Fe-S cluster assembly ATP-binding protein